MQAPTSSRQHTQKLALGAELRMPHLRLLTLDLSGSQFDRFESLANKVFNSLPSLRTLHFSSCSLGNDEAKALAPLYQKSALLHLNLSNNQIVDAMPLHEACWALRREEIQSTVDLTGNKISDYVAAQFAVLQQWDGLDLADMQRRLQQVELAQAAAAAKKIISYTAMRDEWQEEDGRLEEFFSEAFGRLEIWYTDAKGVQTKHLAIKRGFLGTIANLLKKKGAAVGTAVAAVTVEVPVLNVLVGGAVFGICYATGAGIDKVVGGSIKDRGKCFFDLNPSSREREEIHLQVAYWLTECFSNQIKWTATSEDALRAAKFGAEMIVGAIHNKSVHADLKSRTKNEPIENLFCWVMKAQVPLEQMAIYKHFGEQLRATIIDVALPDKCLKYSKNDNLAKKFAKAKIKGMTGAIAINADGGSYVWPVWDFFTKPGVIYNEAKHSHPKWHRPEFDVCGGDGEMVTLRQLKKE